MHWFSVGVAVLAAAAIAVIGGIYLFTLRTATQSFGLPLSEPGPNIAWWLRLKRSRDIVSGLVVVAVLVWGTPRLLDFVIAVEALIPLGDITLVSAGRGSTARALGIHLPYGGFIIAGALPLITGPG